MQILYSLIYMQIVLVVVSVPGWCEYNFWPLKYRSTQPVLQENEFIKMLDVLNVSQQDNAPLKRHAYKTLYIKLLFHSTTGYLIK